MANASMTIFVIYDVPQVGKRRALQVVPVAVVGVLVNGEPPQFPCRLQLPDVAFAIVQVPAPGGDRRRAVLRPELSAPEDPQIAVVLPGVLLVGRLYRWVLFLGQHK